MKFSASLTSAAETNESVEAMLMLSLRQASSSSSLAKMSAILSEDDNHVHTTVVSICDYIMCKSAHKNTDTSIITMNDLRLCCKAEPIFLHWSYKVT